MPDFTYRQSGMFVALMPETPQATQTWNREIAPKTQGTGKILAFQFPEVKTQLEKAGFTVRKAKKVNDADLLNLLS